MDSDHLKSKTLAALDALQAELDREAAAKKFVEDSLANKNQGGVIQVPASRKVCLPHPVDENGAELPWVHPAEALYFGKSFINYVPTDDEDFFECENPIHAKLRDLANDWEKARQSAFANDLRACIPGEPREGVPSDVSALLESVQEVRTALQRAGALLDCQELLKYMLAKGVTKFTSPKSLQNALRKAGVPPKVSGGLGAGNKSLYDPNEAIGALCQKES